MPAEPEVRGYPRLEFATISTIVYVVAAALLAYPAAFLGLGVQALGASLGWWAGDPNSNDGEEGFATAIGVGSTVVVLGIAAGIVVAFARRYRLRALPAIGIGSGVILAGLAVFTAWVVNA